MLMHCLYFKLHDSGDAPVEEFMDICRRHLVPHEGIVSAFIGRRADIPRDVVDKDYDVFVTLLFSDISFHDRYQVAELHLAFREKYSPRWSGVRIFDSDVESVDRREND
jgi:hypothetical protein